MNLDESRIAAMRHQIMTEVTSDQRRRTHRLRSGAAAFMGVLVIGGLGIATLPNLGNGDNDFAAAPGGEPADHPSEAPPAGEELGEEPDMGAAPPPILGRGDDPLPEESAPIPDPAIVSQTVVHIVADDPRATVREVRAWAEEFDGVVAASRESDLDHEESGNSVTVHIPAASLNEAIEDLDRFGQVGSTDVTNINVTAQVQDLDRDIRAARGSIDRLHGIIERSESDEALQAETSLSERETELEELLFEREQLAERVSLSAVTVTFDSADDGSSGFLGGLTTVLPWIALVLVALLAGWLFMRRGRDAHRPVQTERTVNQWT